MQQFFEHGPPERGQAFPPAGGKAPGYLKLFLPAGLHKIRVEANGKFGEVIVDLAPLDIVNPDIVLERPL